MWVTVGVALEVRILVGPTVVASESAQEEAPWSD